MTELATLAQRYFAEQAAFNTTTLEDDSTEATDALADRTFLPVLRQIVGVPVRNDKDALAAVDLLLDSGDGCMIDLSDDGTIFERVDYSVIHALRDYLARKVAS